MLFCPGSVSSQSFDLESDLRRTLFTAALFNELKFISVLVKRKKRSTGSDKDINNGPYTI